MAYGTSPEAVQEREKIPKILTRAMVTLCVSTLLIVAYARFTDRPLEGAPDHGAPTIAERQIIIDGEMSGAARVLDETGQVIAQLKANEGGFVSGVYRVLVHERKKNDVPLAAPVRLVAFEDGRLALYDDFTGWRAELIGFGRDNYAVFARLIAPVASGRIQPGATPPDPSAQP